MTTAKHHINITHSWTTLLSNLHIYKLYRPQLGATSQHICLIDFLNMPALLDGVERVKLLGVSFQHNNFKFDAYVNLVLRQCIVKTISVQTPTLPGNACVRLRVRAYV